MSAGLRLRVRTPQGLLIDRQVEAISAEDHDGWFGLRPGRRGLVAALPPGLLVFREPAGPEAAREWFVAHAGGLLDLGGAPGGDGAREPGECRVMTLEAVVSSDLEQVAAEVERHVATRTARGQRQRDVLQDLAREALRRLAREARTP